MKKSIFIILLLVLQISFSAFSQKNYTPTTEVLKAREWFQDARFGMFIHWGASSVLGDGEWVMNNTNIYVEDYKKLQDIFNPQKFDAKKWVSVAKQAGMKYITFITRHHDSFSNWDTKFSDWKITNTPYGKDVLKQLAEECRKQDMKLFFYYSLLDWYRTDYQYETGRTGQGTGREEKGDWNDYIQFMKNQLTELLTNYGDVAGVWFDGHWDQVTYNETTKKWEGESKVDWHYDEIYSLIHKLQPKALIGNNHHLAPIAGEDFQMFERDLPGSNTTGWGTDVNLISKLPLETCETLNGSWGFDITDRKYKSAKELVHLLTKAAGLSANLLLNIGPLPNGEIQEEFVSRLDSVGKWMNKYGESIYGTKGDIVRNENWGTFTRKGNIVYMHVLDEDARNITIPDFPFKKIKKCTSAVNGKKVEATLKNNMLWVNVGPIERDPMNTVIKIELK